MPAGLTHISDALFFLGFPFLLIAASISLICSPCLSVSPLHFVPIPFHHLHLCLFHSLFSLFFSLCPFPLLTCHPPCPGSSVSGHDESPGDHAATDAADPSAAGAFSPAAPGLAPAAAGCYAAAGTHTHTHSLT